MLETSTQSRITWEKLQSAIVVFSEKLKSALIDLGILEECKDLEIDHICVRLKNKDDVFTLKEQLLKVGQIISAVNVNGREIAIIQLTQPLNLGSWQTCGVELPFPKQKHDHSDGWEHVEFVLNCAENTMSGVRDAFKNKFPNLTPEKLQTDYSYSEDETHADGDQIPNPTIGIKVNGIGLKFHANPIQEVVGFIK